MDPRIQELMKSLGAPPLPPPPAPPAPTSGTSMAAIMAPGINQVQTFTRPLEEIEAFTADVNAFLAGLPPQVPVIGSSFSCIDGRVALMLTIRIPVSE